MEENPHAHEAENEQRPPRFATGGNSTPLRRRGQYNMHRQLHRLAMQPQSERASNLLFGGPYGSPGIPSLRRPQYSPGGSATNSVQNQRGRPAAPLQNEAKRHLNANIIALYPMVVGMGFK